MNPVLLLILKIFGIVFLVSLVFSLLVMILMFLAYRNSWRQYLNRDFDHEDLGTVERGKEPW